MATTNWSNPDENLLKDKNLLRKSALQAAGGVVTAAQGQAKALEGERAGMNLGYDQALESGQRSIRADMGQGLASASFGSGRAGHAGYGASLQAAEAGGRSQADLFGDIAMKRAQGNLALTQGVNEANMQGAQAGFEGLNTIAKMGTEDENFRSTMKDVTAQVDGIIERNKGWLNDDEDTMAQQILALVPQYADNPKVQEYLKNKAMAITQKVSIGDAHPEDV